MNPILCEACHTFPACHTVSVGGASPQRWICQACQERLAFPASDPRWAEAHPGWIPFAIAQAREDAAAAVAGVRRDLARQLDARMAAVAMPRTIRAILDAQLATDPWPVAFVCSLGYLEIARYAPNPDTGLWELRMAMRDGPAALLLAQREDVLDALDKALAGVLAPDAAVRLDYR